MNAAIFHYSFVHDIGKHYFSSHKKSQSKPFNYHIQKLSCKKRILNTRFFFFAKKWFASWGKRFKTPI